MTEFSHDPRATRMCGGDQTRTPAEVVISWGREIARRLDGELLETTRDAEGVGVLILDSKREAIWLVSGACWDHARRALFTPADLGAWRRERPGVGPILTVQPWAPEPSTAMARGVVGVDGSAGSYAAARRAALLVSAGAGVGELLLVHACRGHGRGRGSGSVWTGELDARREEAACWLHPLAEELRAPRLRVEAVTGPSRASDLIPGMCQRAEAGVAALGARIAPERQPAVPRGQTAARVLRSAPCPVLTEG